MKLGQPRIGITVAEHPGLLLGMAMIALLGLGLWGRDWTSSAWRAALAPLLGAMAGLLILMSPVVTVTKIEIDRPGNQSRILNVVVFPGPARPKSTVVVGNAGVEQATSTEGEPNPLFKGEG